MAKNELPTQSFRKEHEELRQKILDVEKKSGALMCKGSQERKKIQKEIISFFDSEILPHAQWEESNLFEKVDEKRSLKNLDWIKVSR